METVNEATASRAREYETIYIVRPDAGEEAAQKVAGRIVETIDRLAGKLTQVQVWGRRRMAYKVRGHAKGVFIYLRYLGFPGLVEELERNFRMLDAVMKYQTVKLTDEVDPSAVTVDPEDVKFVGMDFSDEPDDDVAEDEGDDDEGGRGDYLDYEPEAARSTARRSEDEGDDGPDADDDASDDEPAEYDDDDSEEKEG